MISLNRQRLKDGRLAPHKPLLLLLAIEAWEQEHELDWLGIKGHLSDLLRNFGEIEGPKPWYPFIRLQNDGWWQVDGFENLKGDALPSELNRLNPNARLTTEFIERFLFSKQSKKEALHFLLSDFPSPRHNELQKYLSEAVSLLKGSSENSTRKYFWVNQSKTYHHERDLGCLWAPLLSKDGRKLHHWERMDEISQGDFILTYAKGTLMGYCVAQSSSFEQPQPELGQALWGKEGRMVEVEYFPFEKPLSREVFVPEIVNLLPSKYSPMTKGGIKGTEGYLFEVSADLCSAVMRVVGMEAEQLGSTQSEVVKMKPQISSGPTEKKVLASRRVTQPQFRMNLIRRWNGRCAVTGCAEVGVLTASHIVPWRHATDAERNDPDNGLLLSPVYDTLFDKEFISFDQKGRIKLGRMMAGQYQALGVTGEECIEGLTEGHLKYLARHRAKLR